MTRFILSTRYASMRRLCHLLWKCVRFYFDWKCGDAVTVKRTTIWINKSNDRLIHFSSAPSSHSILFAKPNATAWNKQKRVNYIFCIVFVCAKLIESLFIAWSNHTTPQSSKCTNFINVYNMNMYKSIKTNPLHWFIILFDKQNSTQLTTFQIKSMKKANLVAFSTHFSVA